MRVISDKEEVRYLPTIPRYLFYGTHTYRYSYRGKQIKQQTKPNEATKSRQWRAISLLPLYININNTALHHANEPSHQSSSHERNVVTLQRSSSGNCRLHPRSSWHDADSSANHRSGRITLWNWRLPPHGAHYSSISIWTAALSIFNTVVSSQCGLSWEDMPRHTQKSTRRLMVPSRLSSQFVT